MTSIKIIEEITFGNLRIGGVPAVIDQGDGSLVWEQNINPNTNNLPYLFPFFVNLCSVMVASSDVDGVVIKTNNSGSPDDQFTLYKDNPLMWDLNKPTSMRFLTSDVTQIFVTNPDETKTAHVKLAVKMSLLND